MIKKVVVVLACILLLFGLAYLPGKFASEIAKFQESVNEFMSHGKNYEER